MSDLNIQSPTTTEERLWAAEAEIKRLRTAVAAEREDCAQLAESFALGSGADGDREDMTARAIATAIRERGLD